MRRNKNTRDFRPARGHVWAPLGVLIAASLLGLSTPTSATELPDCDSIEDSEPCGRTQGILKLDLGSDGINEWRFTPGAGSSVPSTTQPLMERRCEIQLSGEEPLVSFSSEPDGSSPGLFDYQGVFSGSNRSNGRGGPCGQIESPDQALNVSLTGALSGSVASYSQVDLRFKGSDVVALIETQLDGVPTGLIHVRTGDAAVGDPAGLSDDNLVRGQTWEDSALLDRDDLPSSPPSPPDVLEVNCQGLVDSGPDSSDRDHCRIQFENAWDTLVISVLPGTDGSVSLAGGNSGGISQPSEFTIAQVFDGILDCGDVATATNPQTGAFAALRRLGNDPEGACDATCVVVPYNLSWAGDDGDELSFIADYLLGEEKPQFCATFEFLARFAPVDVSTLRTQDDGNTPEDERAVPVSGDFADTVTANVPLIFEQQFLPTDPAYFLDACLGTPEYAAFDFNTDNPLSYPVFGDLLNVFPPSIGADFPDMSGAVGTQYGCWLDLRLKYGITDDANPSTTDDCPVPYDAEQCVVDDDEVEDVVRPEVRGFLKGDWVLNRF